MELRIFLEHWKRPRGLVDENKIIMSLTHYHVSSSFKASLLSIGNIFGSLVGGVTAASIGRINTLFFCGIPPIGCFIMICLANDLWYVYFGMFFGGLSNSAAHAVVGEQFVISEVKSTLN